MNILNVQFKLKGGLQNSVISMRRHGLTEKRYSQESAHTVRTHTICRSHNETRTETLAVMVNTTQSVTRTVNASIKTVKRIHATVFKHKKNVIATALVSHSFLWLYFDLIFEFNIIF